MATFRAEVPAVRELMQRKLVCVSGKGGVGKTSVAQAMALALSWAGHRTLYIAFEDPARPPGELRNLGSRLWSLNCDPDLAFEEYAGLKIGSGPLARLFTGNKLVRYLSKAAPGIHELVQLGKVWHERQNYDRVVVDMPSTGYGIALFQSTENFAGLFHGGPIHRDASAMLETFGDPRESGQLIVALPEEMPLREGLELRQELVTRFPENAPGFLVNRRFPKSAAKATDSRSPIAASEADYAAKRAELEAMNLKIWEDAGITIEELPFVPPVASSNSQALVGKLAELLQPWAKARAS